MRKYLCSAFVASILIALLTFPPQALAWGGVGHEAVAYIAWHKFTNTPKDQAIKNRIIQLISLVPSLEGDRTLKNGTKKHFKIEGFTEWKAEMPANLSADEQNCYYFMRAATWPDTIKSTFLDDTDVVAEEKHDPKANVGFADQSSHGYWHFVDDAITSDVSKLPKTPEPNASTQIIALRTDIASNETDLLKAYDLLWLEHLVGDIHQPLHGTVRFFKNAGDLGGNKVFVDPSQVDLNIEKPFFCLDPTRPCKPSKATVKLHAFWDDLPENNAGNQYAQAVAFAKSIPAVSDANTSPDVWAQESKALAVKDSYMAPIGPGPAPPTGTSYKLDATYYKTAEKDAQARIAIAGDRLKTLLAANLK